MSRGPIPLKAGLFVCWETSGINKALAETDMIAHPTTVLGFDETGLDVQTLHEKCDIEMVLNCCADSAGT